MKPNNTTGSDINHLITAKLLKRFQQIGCQENQEDPIVVAKFFNPCGRETWYATEYDPETKCIFCFITGMFEDEWGYVSMEELANIRVGLFKLPLEQDLWFEEMLISEALKRDRLKYN